MTDIATLLHETDAVGLGQLVARREVKPTELLEAAIARADAVNPALNLLAQDCRGRARAQASRPLPSLPLAGVPFLVKDLGIDIAGVPTGSGSRFLARTPDLSSTFVERADAAGLLIFGKTTTPELGLTVTTESLAHGVTRNPWNPAKTSGGSSGGAAAAVAAGVVPLAQASDGGGSVRVPASCCGLLGLKTSRGRIPLGPGRVEDWSGLSGIGPISRSVRDAAAFLDIFALPAAGDRVRPPRPASYLAALSDPLPRLKVALMPAPYPRAEVHADVASAFTDAAGLLARLGHRLHEARPEIDWPALMEANSTNIAAATARSISAQAQRLGRQPQPGELEQITSMWLHINSSRTAVHMQEAVAAFELAAIAVDAFFASHDLLLSPVLATPPVDLGILRLDQDSKHFGEAFGRFCPFAALANISGCPAISLPLGTSADGLPIGIMAMAPFGAEHLLLQLAAELEREAPWADRRPAV